MGFYDSIRVGASGTGESYEVEKSLRFDNGSSAYLSRTAGSPTNQNKGTFSGWVKRTKNAHGTVIFGGGGGSQTNTNAEQLAYISSDTIASSYKGGLGGCSIGWYMYGTRKLRDLSAWMHICISFDWTQSGDSNRLKFYINGVQDTLNSCGNTGAGFQYVNVSGATQYMGRQDAGGGPYYSHHYLAEAYFIDGTVYTPSDFTETDSATGQLMPKDSSEVLDAITLGNNGGYYNFSDTSNLGKDHSSNSNDFTPNNFSVSAGAGNDSVEDTPTNNFCTLNPVDQLGSITFSEGNLKASVGDNEEARGTFAVASGKWYWEVTVDTMNFSFIGVKNMEGDATSKHWLDGKGIGYYGADGNRYGIGSSTSYGASYAATDVIGVALDMDNESITFYKNNSSQGAIDFSSTSYERLAPAASSAASDSVYTFNFGQRTFAYTPPSGYKSLCSANLPNPTIKLPNKYFDTELYTGTSSTVTVNTLEFQPDLVWCKVRSKANRHAYFDSVRGVTKRLHSNLSDAEVTDADTLTSFNSNGFTIGADAGDFGSNANGHTFVAWNWKAGTSFSNSAGSNSATIASSGSVNTTAGVSIISYQGTGANNTDVAIAHGLGVAPDFVWIKNRTSAGLARNWHKGLSSDSTYSIKNIIIRQDTGEAGYGSQIRAVSSSTFTVRDVDANGNLSVNKSGDNYIAYCFSGVEGYSKFGSYTGNGSTDGTFVFTGFRPAFLICKKISDTGNWGINDIKRDINTEYGNDASVYANTSDAETTSSSLNADFLSNGFKLRSNNSSYNGSGGKYIYLCFAEFPFKYARAR